MTGRDLVPRSSVQKHGSQSLIDGARDLRAGSLGAATSRSPLLRGRAGGFRFPSARRSLRQFHEPT